MRIFYTILAFIAFSMAASADTIVFDFGNNEFNLPTTSNTSDSKGAFDNPVSKDGINITFSKGSGQISPLMYLSTFNNSIDLRCYKGNKFTIASTTGSPIDSINFVNSGKLNVVGNPEGTWGGTYYSTWMGEAASIDFDVNGSTQVTKIIVYTSNSAVSVAKPLFTPANTELYSTTQVAITSPTVGANVYYTTNGEEPTTASTKYDNPITIEKATTLKAVAELNGTLSEVSSIEYTFPTCDVVSDFSEFENSTSENPIKVTSNSVVTFQNGKYLFLRDMSGNAMQVYGTLDYTYENGDLLAGGIVGNKDNYSGTTQFAPIASTFSNPIGTYSSEPAEVAIADIQNHVNDYVIGRNYSLAITKNGNKKVYTLSDDNDEIGIFERFKNITMPTEDGTYDVIAIGNIFNGTYQLYPISFTKTSSVADVNMDNIKVIATTGAIEIDNNGNATDLKVYSITGQQMYANNIATGKHFIALPQGIYIVKVQNKAWKVAVK